MPPAPTPLMFTLMHASYIIADRSLFFPQGPSGPKGEKVCSSIDIVITVRLDWSSREALVQRLVILKQVNRGTQALSSSLSSLSINQMSNRLHVFVATLTRLSKSIHQGRFRELPDVFPLRGPQPNLRLWESAQGATPCGCLTLSFLFSLYIPAKIRTISVRRHLHHFPRPISCLF